MIEPWILPPALALIAAVLALGPLGTQVLQRGVVFIDLAIAQAAAAAALAATLIGDHPSWWIIHGASTLGALLMAGAVALLSRRWPALREALIGLVYVACASLALLTASHDPHGAEHLHALLAADVLWSDWNQAAVLGVCALVVLALGRRLDKDRWFFPVFAVVASIAVQTLGLFVVFAALITPGLWQRRLHTRKAIAVAIAGAACFSGLALSWVLDAPSGPWVALSLALTGVMSALVPGMIRSDTSALRRPTADPSAPSASTRRID